MNIEFKDYGPISGARLINIKVIKNDSDTIYEGKIEDAPEDILKLHYWKIELNSTATYYVYDKEYLEKHCK